MIADNGVIIRTHVSDISTISRVSQGVKVMKLRNGSHIVSVAVTRREDDEENTEEIDTDELTEQPETNEEEQVISTDNEIE